MNKFILALAFGLGICYNTPSFAAGNPGVIPTVPQGKIIKQGDCVPIEAWMVHYFDVDPAVGYGYFEKDFVKLLDVLESHYGPAPSTSGMDANQVFVGIDLQDGLTDWFLADDNDCFTAHLGPLEMETTLEYFMEAGVQPDFGPTFFKTPDDSQHPLTPPHPEKPKDPGI